MTDNPWRLGDLNELILKFAALGEDQIVQKLETIRTTLCNLDALKGAVAQQRKPPLEALTELQSAVGEILATLDRIETEDARQRAAL